MLLALPEALERCLHTVVRCSEHGFVVFSQTSFSRFNTALFPHYYVNNECGQTSDLTCKETTTSLFQEILDGSIVLLQLRHWPNYRGDLVILHRFRN